MADFDTDIQDMKFVNDVLYFRLSDNNYNNKIAFYESSTNGFGSYSQIPYQLGNDTNTVHRFEIDNYGQLLLLVSDNFGNYKINSYKFAPEITIPSGSLTGILELNGIEDDLNSPGEESDETIEISILEPFNAIIEESNEFDDITLTILNNEIDLVLDEDALNILSMANSSVMGDYDGDGDQDLPYHYSFNAGTITQLYENVDGVFVNSSPGLFNRLNLEM